MMADENQKEKHEQDSRKSRFSFLSWKNKFDKTYVSDLRQQWENMDKIERQKFILGAFIGLIIFIGGITLLFILMNGLIQH